MEEPSGSVGAVDSASRYVAEIDESNDNDSHVLLLRLAGGGRRVLDVGCAAGDLTEALRRRNPVVVGIEKDPGAAAVARAKLVDVVIGDVESMDLVERFGPESFDTIVFGDVLEHLVDPAEALRRVKPLLARRGVVVASVPNVAHGAVRLALLRGAFEYTDVGLLDRTHLRFFTRGSVAELFEAAGFALVEVLETTVPPLAAPDIEITAGEFPPSVLATVEDDPDAHVYQFVVRAVVDDADQAISRLYRRLREHERAGEGRRLPRAEDTAGTPLHVAVAGADDRPSTTWCLEVLRRELERRLVDRQVRCTTDVAPEGSIADVVVDLAPATIGGRPAIDLGAHRLLPSTERVDGSALFGLGLLAARLEKTADEAQSLALLRLVGALPPEESYVVVAIDRAQVESAADLQIVLDRIATTHGPLVDLAIDAHGPSAADARPTFKIPPDASALDAIAAVGGARAVITTDELVAAVALGLGTPHALLRQTDPSATLVAATSGGHASAPTDVEHALLRSASADTAHKVAVLVTTVDDALDQILPDVDVLRPDAGDPRAAHLERVVVALQEKLLTERTRIRRGLEADGLLRTAAPSTSDDHELDALRRAADSYRRLLADLQEELHTATRRPPSGPETPHPTPRMRATVGRWLRRFGLRSL